MFHPTRGAGPFTWMHPGGFLVYRHLRLSWYAMHDGFRTLFFFVRELCGWSVSLRNLQGQAGPVSHTTPCKAPKTAF